MFIETDRITLRSAEPEDAAQIYAWENDRNIWRVSGTFVPYTHFQIEQFLLNSNDIFSQQQLRLMICQGKTDIGCIDIFDYDAINERAGIGILIDSKFRHQGYAKDAISLLLDYLFNNLMLKQVHCSIDALNEESQHLFKGLGFELCGCRKQWLKTPDGFIDEYLFQLINPKHA